MYRLVNDITSVTMSPRMEMFRGQLLHFGTGDLSSGLPCRTDFNYAISPVELLITVTRDTDSGAPGTGCKVL